MIKEVFNLKIQAFSKIFFWKNQEKIFYFSGYKADNGLLFSLINDPADAPDSPALFDVISDLIFTFTTDCVRCSPVLSNFFCSNLSGATEYRSRRNNLLKYRPIPPLLTGGNFLLWSVILTSNKSVLRKFRLETKFSLFEFP